MRAWRLLHNSYDRWIQFHTAHRFAFEIAGSLTLLAFGIALIID